LLYPANYIEVSSVRHGDRNMKLRLAFLHSGDRGRTWTPQVIDFDWRQSISEPSAALLPNGRVLCVARSDTQRSMWQLWSDDGGRTWSAPEPIGFPGHCPFLLLTREGILVLAHRLPGTSIHYSLDCGRTWKRNTQISPASGAYPWMTQLRDGRIFISYSHFRRTMPKPLYAQFLVATGAGLR